MYLYRHALPADDERLLALYGACFNKQFSADWWQWYRRAGQFTCVVECGARLVAAYSLLPLWLHIGEDVHAASLCNNVCVHPEFQGKGLFTHLGRYALDQEGKRGIRISLGMPNAKAFPGHLKVGWRTLMGLPKLVKPSPRRRAHQSFSIAEFDGRINELLSQTFERVGLAAARDFKWLNWRFVTRPERYYKLFVYEEQRQTMGYIVVKHFDADGERRAHICDYAARTPEVMLDLIATATDYSAGRDSLDLWTNPRAPWREVFEADGFVEQETTDRLITHCNYGSAMPISDGPVTFSYADNDVH